MKLSNEELDLFELAFNLRIPLYKLMEEMPYEELLGWADYFKRRPIGWREDHRASLLIAASGAKIKASDLFPSLKALEENNIASDEDVKINSLFKSSLFNRMLSAQGGDNILKDLMNGDKSEES